MTPKIGFFAENAHDADVVRLAYIDDVMAAMTMNPDGRVEFPSFTG